MHSFLAGDTGQYWGNGEGLYWRTGEMGMVSTGETLKLGHERGLAFARHNWGCGLGGGDQAEKNNHLKMI